MTTSTEIDDMPTRNSAGWLALAAAPTFAAMAWVVSGSATMICSSDASPLPMDGMAWMYLLMGLFHLPPWLKLVSRPHHSHMQTRGE